MRNLTQFIVRSLLVFKSFLNIQHVFFSLICHGNVWRHDIIVYWMQHYLRSWGWGVRKPNFIPSISWNWCKCWHHKFWLSLICTKIFPKTVLFAWWQLKSRNSANLTKLTSAESERQIEAHNYMEGRIWSSSSWESHAGWCEARRHCWRVWISSEGVRGHSYFQQSRNKLPCLGWETFLTWDSGSHMATIAFLIGENLGKDMEQIKRN